jgi:glutamine synthetase
MAARREHGLGWAVAGQALTPFSEIAINPWGPISEVRQVPGPSAHVTLPAYAGAAPFDLTLCDSLNSDGSSWDCCTRGFARKALAALESDFGLRFVGAFEHEFTLSGGDITPGAPFTVEALRVAPRFTADLADALSQAGLEPETVEPEYGYLQYEVTTAPAIGLAAADRTTGAAASPASASRTARPPSTSASHQPGIPSARPVASTWNIGRPMPPRAPT